MESNKIESFRCLPSICDVPGSTRDERAPSARELEPVPHLLLCRVPRRVVTPLAPDFCRHREWGGSLGMPATRPPERKLKAPANAKAGQSPPAPWTPPHASRTPRLWPPQFPRLVSIDLTLPGLFFFPFKRDPSIFGISACQTSLLSLAKQGMERSPNRLLARRGLLSEEALWVRSPSEGQCRLRRRAGHGCRLLNARLSV